MPSVVTPMAATLNCELRSRGLRLPAAECEHILRIVIAATAAIAQAHETSRSAMPPAETPGGGGIGGDASAAAFSSAAREAMARKFERAFQCRLRMPHHDDLMHRDDPLIDGAELRWLASIIRGTPDQQSPSSAMPAPRTSDGGRDPSGDAPAVPSPHDRQLADLLITAEAFRAAMIESGACVKVSQNLYIEHLRALERALNPLNYRGCL